MALLAVVLAAAPARAPAADPLSQDQLTLARLYVPQIAEPQWVAVVGPGELKSSVDGVEVQGAGRWDGRLGACVQSSAGVVFSPPVMPRLPISPDTLVQDVLAQKPPAAGRFAALSYAIPAGRRWGAQACSHGRLLGYFRLDPTLNATPARLAAIARPLRRLDRALRRRAGARIPCLTAQACEVWRREQAQTPGLQDVFYVMQCRAGLVAEIDSGLWPPGSAVAITFRAKGVLVTPAIYRVEPWQAAHASLDQGSATKDGAGGKAGCSAATSPSGLR